MSTSITIGEVPDEVRDELAARAALCGRSLEDYIRDELLALAKRPSAAVWMARVRARKDALQSQDAPQGQESTGAGACSAPPSDRDPPSAPRTSEGRVEQRDVG
jgi:plasmid stability protein